jgi:hypothetical protein
MAKMTVSLTLKIEIEDTEEWTTTFGVQGSNAIRADVKEYAGSLVRSGVFANGEVAAEITWR